MLGVLVLGIIFAASLISVFWYNKDKPWGILVCICKSTVRKRSCLSPNLIKTIYFSVLSETNSGNSFQVT